MFINLPNLNDLIRQSRVRQDRDPYLITGYCTTGTRPDRNPKYKCYTPEHMFPGDVFPTYVGGPAYLMSRQAAVILYETALETPFFHLEDVFITGIVREKFNNEDGARSVRYSALKDAEKISLTE